MAGRGRGWVTAEYGMLPGSTSPRKRRDVGKVDGRTTEIQRLIGRSLRAIVDLDALGERSIFLDCDVLEADGGTRTASITGAFVALVDALGTIEDLNVNPLRDSVAAISVGIVDGEPLLDLDYREDVDAEVDMNVVMTGGGRFVEVQGTGEEATFSEEELVALLKLARGGLAEFARCNKGRSATPGRLAEHLAAADGLESVLDMLDRGPPGFLGPGDGQNVEAGRIFQQIVSLEIRQSQPGEPLLFLRPDRFRRMPRIVRRAGFHFDEHDRAVVDGHEIELAELIALVTANNLVAQAAHDTALPHVRPARPAIDIAARRNARASRTSEHASDSSDNVAATTIECRPSFSLVTARARRQIEQLSDVPRITLAIGSCERVIRTGGNGVNRGLSVISAASC